MATLQALGSVVSGENGSSDAEDDPQRGTDSEWESWDESGGCSSKSLFTDRHLPSAEAAMTFDGDEFDFDLRKFQQQARLSQVEMIKCINFIRRRVQAGADAGNVIRDLGTGRTALVADDVNLLPVIADDGLLLFDFEDEIEVDAGGTPAGQNAQSDAQEIVRLRDENAALKQALQQLRDTALPYQECTGAEAEEQSTERALATGQQQSSGLSTAQGPPSMRSSRRHRASSVDESYFASYGHYGIHRDMLADKSRTEGYQQAITACVHANPDCTVLDVGCGTGILSMFAARAGAQAVIGVEGNQEMAAMAEQICAANGLSKDHGGTITIVSGQVEQLQQLPVSQVDVLVSEWMGYALLYESMLATVLHARDRWLRPGGFMLPDRAALYIAGVASAKDDLAFWDSVYGLSMAPVRRALHQERLGHVAVVPVSWDDLVTEPVCIQEFDLETMRPRDVDFSKQFWMTACCEAARECAAVAVWFDVDFGSHAGSSDWHSRLSTSPVSQLTHWAQAILTLRKGIQVQAASKLSEQQPVAAGISGHISFARSSKHRSLDISLSYGPCDREGQACSHLETLIYDMASD